MAYSLVKESLFCFCCRLFGVVDKAGFNSINGFKKWWKLNPKVLEHESSSAHNDNFNKWKSLEVRLQVGATIDKQEQNMIVKEEQKLRLVLVRILDIIRFLAKQNLALRGHREIMKENDAENRGNFLGLVHLLGKYDPVLCEHLTKLKLQKKARENGKIEYSISSGNENGDFEITKNGTIFTKRHLDRENQSLYNLLVIATDKAPIPEDRLSSSVQVTIVLKDVNDMSPEFITPNETTVAENIPINTVVMAIKAVDKDEGRNGYIEYSLSDDPVINGIFSLGPVDGLLKVAGRIDRETTSNYTLIVHAKDRGDPPKSTQAKIFVRVLDENDNSPVFDPKQYSASISENASIGASVLQVSATDIDDGFNGRVRYSIISGDINRDFSIIEDTGVIRVAKNLNYERKSRYTLIVKAEDCAGNYYFRILHLPRNIHVDAMS
ncbi:unnamed protein product [Acanthoscelides obtectus]|uniref:Cadherin domain-containing protein n=1 Tax=Acanthoscelides obtectus TaxID=200917 RepID=A0A9P0QAM6_ACAOB|nr:unnamed protein product [Acanthoscelides obtectus]CAK1631790.1 Cadherin-related tumor suppressor [Acanthoscelides obtectus]